MLSWVSGPTDPNSVTNRHCILLNLLAPKGSPSNYPSDYVTESNEQVNKIMLERSKDQVLLYQNRLQKLIQPGCLVSIHDVTNPSEP